MYRKMSVTALLLVMILLLSACGAKPADSSNGSDGEASVIQAPQSVAAATEVAAQPVEDEGHMLYDVVPSKYEYGVYVNMNTKTGDALSDYSVALNNFADRDAYVLYSQNGLSHVREALSSLDEAGLEALVTEGRAMKIRTNDGFHPLDDKMESLEGHAYNPEEKDNFYYIYAVYMGTSGAEVEKASRFIAPIDGPEALARYSASDIGSIVPAGGATSMFIESSSYSPDYINALVQGAREAGIETPRVAVIETTVGTEDEMYDDMFLPDGEYASFSDTLRARGMEPVYIPLGIDNYQHVQNTKYFADLVRSCHIVFFTGGDQAYYGLALANSDGTPSLVAEAIVDVLRSGGTLGGSSAGAAAMSGIVLTNGASGSYQPLYWNQAEIVDVCSYTAETVADNDTVNDGNNMLYSSIGFVEPVLGQDILLDTHVDARGRIGRLIAGLRDSNPTGIAIGIDETAGIRIDGSTKTGTAFGSSGVYIIDASNAVWGKAGTEGEFSVEGLVLHYLTVGDQYDFSTGTVIPSEGKRVIVPSGDPYFTEDLFGTDETGTTLMTFAHSSAKTVTAEVANTMTMPFLMGNLYTVTFEKTSATKCYASDELFPNPEYFGTFQRTTIEGMGVTIAYGPTKFDPTAGGDFEPLSASSEANGYAVGITFSGPISIGYEGNNKYFLDCEEPDNIPDDYVAVFDASGAPKAQDRVYTFRVDNTDTLRIVLDEDIYFAEGDTILVKTGVTSLYGTQTTTETTFRLTNGQWIK